MMEISCSNCGLAFPLEGFPYCCWKCGGIYDHHLPIPFVPTQVDRSQPGIWPYRHIFGLSKEVDPISLGEGCTPLCWINVFGRNVAFKCEQLNPSGSFKDRGSTVMTAWLQSRGICEAIEDSSGNAGASLAAYLTRADIRGRIFIPKSTSGPKRRQIESYGVEIVQVSGTRKDATEAARTEVRGRTAYASHAYLPFNLLGYATAAFEIFEQLGNKLPGTFVVPAGQGGLLIGLARGFESLRIANRIASPVPRIIAVQASSCAPLYLQFSGGNLREEIITENHSIAEGVQVTHPLRKFSILKEVIASQGLICSVEENEILPGCTTLAHFGFYVEPTSAIVWAALNKTIRDLPDPVVVILTGSGYKNEQERA
jgi:threonine synthase